MTRCKHVEEWTFFKLSITSQDPDLDQETVFDEMTWRQWINSALKRSYGIFGEGIEFYIVKHDNSTLYVKVAKTDKDIFAQSVATYVSSDELVGKPLVVSILIETTNVYKLSQDNDDKLWLKKLKEDIDMDQQCEA